VLSGHLKTVLHALDSRSKQVTLCIGVADSVVRHAELPYITVPDMRQMLKFNAKNYLQQEFLDYSFDCYILPPHSLPKEAPKHGVGQKQKVLVGGARQKLLDDLISASRQAGLVADMVVPGLIGPINAFELAQPELFSKEVVALVDLGFKNSTICCLEHGELILSRVVGVGGDKLTSGLGESLGISYAEAESIKVGMAAEVQSNLEPLLLPLGRELRASVDFFEHQQDKTVQQVFVSGGSARSEFIIQTLQTELTIPCKSWDPTTFLEMALPPQLIGEIGQVAPQLAVALGAAACNF
jgi:type IV pilus assembly protein PilM